MTFLANTFDGGAHATAVTVGNSGTGLDTPFSEVVLAGNGSVTYDASAVVTGLAAKISVGTGYISGEHQARLRMPLPDQQRSFGRMELFLPAYPELGRSVPLWQIPVTVPPGGNPDQNSVIDLWVDGEGRFIIRCLAGGNWLETPADAAPVGVWCRLEWDIRVGGDAVRNGELRIYPNPGATTPSVTVTTDYITGWIISGYTADDILFGAGGVYPGVNVWTGVDYWIDNVAVTDIGFPGPYRAGQVVVSPIVVTATSPAPPKTFTVDYDEYDSAGWVTITSSGGTYTSAPVDNTYFTVEPGETDVSPFDHSAWWYYTPAESGLVTVDTELTTAIVAGVPTDTGVYIYTGTTLTDLVEVASDWGSGTDYLWSVTTFEATAGTTYRVTVGTWGDNRQNYVLRITSPMSVFEFVARVEAASPAPSITPTPPQVITAPVAVAHAHAGGDVPLWITAPVAVAHAHAGGDVPLWITAPPVCVGAVSPPPGLLAFVFTLLEPEQGGDIPATTPTFVATLTLGTFDTPGVSDTGCQARVTVTAWPQNTVTSTVVDIDITADTVAAIVVAWPTPLEDADNYDWTIEFFDGHQWRTNYDAWSYFYIDPAIGDAWTFTTAIVNATALSEPQLCYVDPPAAETGEQVTAYGVGLPMSNTAAFIGDTPVTVTAVRSVPATAEAYTGARTVDPFGRFDPEHVEVDLEIPVIDEPGGPLRIEGDPP